MLTGSNTRFIFAAISLSLLLTSCGDDSSNDDIQQEQTQKQTGTFRTNLDPINNGTTQGEANFVVDENNFSASLTTQNAPDGATIGQYVMFGNTCPQNAATMAEAIHVTGAILIPLDNDLSDQYKGGVYPVATGGNTSYQASTDYEDMITNLRDPDPNKSDNIRKLNPDELLNMEGRVVMVTRIQGADEVPLACGILTRI